MSKKGSSIVVDLNVVGTDPFMSQVMSAITSILKALSWISFKSNNTGAFGSQYAPAINSFV